MKIIVYVLATAGLFLAHVGAHAQSWCPQIKQGSIWLPDSHAADLATLLNAADVLNRMDKCVIEGGWSAGLRSFYLVIREPGTKPTIRPYSGAELRSLASLGQRPP